MHCDTLLLRLFLLAAQVQAEEFLFDEIGAGPALDLAGGPSCEVAIAWIAQTGHQQILFMQNAGGRGRIRSNVRLSEAQQQIALIHYERAIQTAFREVSDALIQYQKVQEVRAKQELLVATLQDRSRLSYTRYRGGVDTLLNALDSDRDLFEAELGLAQTKRNELLAIVQLYRALGGGWQV